MVNHGSMAGRDGCRAQEHEAESALLPVSKPRHACRFQRCPRPAMSRAERGWLIRLKQCALARHRIEISTGLVRDWRSGDDAIGEFGV
jgi:hypothetical protein